MLGNYDEGNCYKIISFFRRLGLNNYAIAGILSNWYYESVLDPGNAQNSYMNALHMTDAEYTRRVDNGTWVHPNTGKDFCEDAIGYGFAQWTSAGRKRGLYNFAKASGTSISDANMQLDYAWKELTSSGYKNVYQTLLLCTDEKEAAVQFMVYYERPAGSTDKKKQQIRANTATEFYQKYFMGGDTTSYLMNASTFINKLKDILYNYKTLYVLGPWGWPATDKNKSRAISKQAYNNTAARKVKINAASRDTFFFDCSGLIKGILWGWCGDPNKAYGGAGYACNGVPNSGALINLCTGVSTNFQTIIPGELLYMDGHVGVYIGDGKVIECSPKWEDGVQMTNLGNTGYTEGHSRVWLKHGKLPWIDYSVVLEEINDTPPAEPTTEDLYPSLELTYTVKPGDNLTKIAKKFSTTVEFLVSYNGIKNPSLILPGQTIKIKGTNAPEEKSDKIYVVKPGDNLTKIAKAYKTTVLALVVKNKILNKNLIIPGQVLYI